jgi:hypothetical protein
MMKGARKMKSGKKKTMSRTKKPASLGSVSRTQRSPASSTSATAREEIQAKLDSLNREFSNLQDELLMTGARNEMGDIETTLSVFPSEIEQLRMRGYVFRSFLENKVNVLAEQWGEMSDRVSRDIERRTRELQREADEAETALRQAASGNASRVSRAEGVINTLDSKVRAAQSAVGAMYQSLQQNINQTKSQVDEIKWTLDEIDEASFGLHPTEDPVLACRAQFMESKKEGPEGVLFLTDARLIFERKEEVATKKVLFITTEKEKVQEVIFEESIGLVDEAKTSQKGFLGHKEMMEVLFAPEADLSEATLRLRGADNEAWAALIGRVKSGEIDKERTQPKDEAVVEAARSAPTKCSTCGATLPADIVRGQREITCEYCGSVVRF